MVARDWRGREITPGCHIVYPTRHGSSLDMQEGVVEQIFEVQDDILWNGQKVWKQALRVRPVRTTGYRNVTATAKPVVIKVLARVTVVDS